MNHGENLGIPSAVLSGAHAWARLGVLALLLVLGVLAVAAATPSCSGRMGTGPAKAASVEAPRAAERETGAGTAVRIGGVDIVAPVGSGVIYRRESAGEELDLSSKTESRGDDPTASADARGASGGAGKRDYAGLAGVIDAAAAGEPRYLSLVVMGALLAAGGVVVLLWLGRKGLGLGLIAGGVAVAALGVVADAAPWVFGLIVLGGAAAVAMVIWHARLARDDDAALRAIVPAVEKAEAQPGGGGKGIKEAIRAEAGASIGAVRGAVRRIKAKTGVG